MSSDIIRVVRLLEYTGPREDVEKHLALVKPDGVYKFGYTAWVEPHDTSDMVMTVTTQSKDIIGIIADVVVEARKK